MKNVIIFGSGLVGSAVRENLESIPDYKLYSYGRSDLDLTDISEVLEKIRAIQPTLVVLCAGVVGGFERNTKEPFTLCMDNARIVTNVIEACRKLEIRDFINLVPASVYPSTIQRRMNPEDLWTGPMESSGVPYSASRLLGVTLVNSSRQQFGYNWVSLISTNVYGDDSGLQSHRDHVIPSLLRKFALATSSNFLEIELLGDGSPIREFLHASDLGEAVKFVYERREFTEPILNISGKSSVTISELAKIIAGIANYTGEIRFAKDAKDAKNGAKFKLLDGSRLHSLGWEPKINLQLGIKRVFANL